MLPYVMHLTRAQSSTHSILARKREPVCPSFCHQLLLRVSGSVTANALSSLQPSFHQADSVRGTRHHGLVERPSRTRFHPLHRRSGDKPGRQISFVVV